MNRRISRKRYTAKQHGGAATLPPFLNFRGITVGEMLTVKQERLDRLQMLKDSLLALNPTSLTFNNFILPQIDIVNENDRTAGAYCSMSDLHFDIDVRQVASDLGSAIDKAWDDVDRNLFNHFKSYYAGKYLEEKASLMPEFNRYIEFRLTNYNDLGMNLTSQQAELIKKLRNDISANEGVMNFNRINYEPTIRVSPGELEGMSEHFIQSRLDAESGQVVLSKNGSSSVFELCKNRNTRRKLHVAVTNNLYPTNLNMMEATLSKRKQLATLLGYKSFTDYAHRRNMNNSSDKINEYIDLLLEKLKPSRMQELEDLNKIARKDGINNILPYDTAYYTNIYEKTALNINTTKLELNFPTFVVAEEILRIYEDIMGYEFKQQIDKKAYLWNDNVLLYDVYEHGSVIGRMFLDLLPRTGKSSGNAMGTFVGKSNTSLPFLGVLGSYGAPYLYLDNIRSLFHEIGHIIHNLSLNSYITRHSKFYWEFDFNEVPSQMFEQLAFEPDILRRILTVTFSKEKYKQSHSDTKALQNFLSEPVQSSPLQPYKGARAFLANAEPLHWNNVSLERASYAERVRNAPIAHLYESSELTPKEREKIEEIIKERLRFKKYEDNKYFTWAYNAKADLLAHDSDYPATPPAEGEHPTDSILINLSKKVYGETLGEERIVRDDAGSMANFFSSWLMPMSPRYAAANSTYLTTLGYAIDLFSLFKQNMKDLSSMGVRAKTILLSWGGAKPSANAIRNFLGREATPAESFAAIFDIPPVLGAPLPVENSSSSSSGGYTTPTANKTRRQMKYRRTRRSKFRL